MLVWAKRLFVGKIWGGEWSLDKAGYSADVTATGILNVGKGRAGYAIGVTASAANQYGVLAFDGKGNHKMLKTHPHTEQLTYTYYPDGHATIIFEGHYFYVVYIN